MTSLTIFGNKAQKLTDGVTYLTLPSSVIPDSVSCFDQNKKSVPFRLLSKHNTLEILPGKGKATVSFLFHGLTWQCLGRFYVTEDKLQLHVLSSIANAEEETLSGVVTLVTGRQNEIHPVAHERVMAKMSNTASLVSLSEPAETALEDYQRYDLGELTLPGTSTTVIPLADYSFPYAKVYLLQSTRNTVSYGYRLLVDDYLPSCNLTLYKDNVYLGSTAFEEARQGDERVVLAGQSSQVGCNNSVLTNDEEAQETLDEHTIKTYTSETITCELSNHTSEEVTILIEHPLRERNIAEIAPKPRKIRNSVAQWEIKLKKKKGKFEATVLYYEILHLDKQL